MKVDFNRLKTEISLPDFLLNLGWNLWPVLLTAALK